MHAVFLASKYSLSCSERPRVSWGKIAHCCLPKIPPFVVMKPESVVSGSQYTHSYITGCYDKTDWIQNVRLLNEARDPIVCGNILLIN